MAEIHNCLIVTKPGENLHVLTQRIDGYAIIPRPDYNALAARLAEATELVRDALRYPHKPGSKHSTWDDRAMKFISAADSASGAPE